MPQLNREVVLWSHPMGTRAMPTHQTEEELQLLDGDVLPFESQAVRYIGVCPAGTEVRDVVDIGEPHRVRCTIEGQRVALVKWAISEPGTGAFFPDAPDRNQDSRPSKGV